ncbi:AAA family ATPase [Saccharothrix sp. HUAS TT1]|uniref:AAA family ATPase n=1 Tax=unclassified Saccharothrix TaxID=2593673 RepID=UPI00345BB5D6
MTPLVERDAETSLLDRVVGDLTAGRSAAVAVIGPPAIGHSALLAHAARVAAGHGVRTVAARARRWETDVEWGVVDQWRASLAPDGSGWPPLDRLRPEQRAAASSDVCSALLATARRTPLLLLVDDVHRADRASTHLLGMLLRRLRQAPIAVVCTGRSAPEAGECTPLRPRPLTAAGGRRVSRDRLGLPGADDRFDAVVEASLGLPGVLVPALDELRDTGARVDVRAVEAAVLRRRAAVVDRTLTGLPAGLLDVVRVLAVAGDAVPLPAARGTAAALDHLRANGLTAAGPAAGDRPRLAPHVAEQVLAGTDPAVRRELHARIAEAAHRVAAPDDVVARLLLGAAPLGAPWAAAVLRRVGRRRLREGHDREAAALLARAAGEPVDPAARAALVVDLACAEGRDRPVVSRRALITAASEGRHRQPAVDLLLVVGDGDAVCRTLPLDQVGDRPGDAGLGKLRRIASLIAGHDVDDRVDARTAAADPVLAGAEAWRLALAGRDLHRARRLASLAVAEQPLLSPRLAGAATLVLTDDLAEARAVLTDMLTDALRVGRRGSAASIAHHLAHAARRAGYLDEAARHLDHALELLPLPAWPARTRAMLIASGTLLEVERGDPDAARRHLALADPASGPGRGRLLHARAAVSLASGDPVSALHDLLDCGRRLAGRGRGNPALVDWRPLAAEALVRLDRADEARTLLAEESRAAAAWGTASCVGAARLAAARWGREPFEPRALAEAEHVLRRSPARLLHVQAQVELSAAELRLGRTREAARLADAAARTARACGAVPVRLHAEALSAAARAGADVPHDRTRRLSELSPAQAKAAELAARGMTNPEIAGVLGVSRRTVELHLTTAYRKLGVAGRGELLALIGGR